MCTNWTNYLHMKCAIVEQTNYTIFFCLVLVVCDRDRIEPTLNSLWKWLDLKILEIQKTNLKTRLKFYKLKKIKTKTKGFFESRIKLSNYAAINTKMFQWRS